MNEAIKLAGRLPHIIGDLEKSQKELKARMAELKRAGLIYAGEHYRNGKYLYLIFRTTSSGERERRYIGCDPVRIKEAKDGISRAKEFDRLAVELRELENRMHHGESQLRTCLNYFANTVQWRQRPPAPARSVSPKGGA